MIQMAATYKTVAICVATYKRPAMLKDCLSAIRSLDCPEGYKFIVIIVDNDIAQSGKLVAEETSTNSLIQLYYFVETKRGIASARNRLLNEALSYNVDLIAFLDDDEFPRQDWLSTLLWSLEKYNADVVTGPVVSLNVNGNQTSSTEEKYLTGQKPRKVSTNNVLFKNSLIISGGLRFDLKLNFTGGEDFDFFDRSSALGNSHVWINDAIIYETIPVERTSKQYLFFRHFTGAINNVVQHRFNNGIIETWLHYIFKILGKTIGAVLSFIVFIMTFDNDKLEKSIVKFASATGYVSGLLNIIVERYR